MGGVAFFHSYSIHVRVFFSTTALIYPTISFYSSLEATFAALYESLGRSLTLYDASTGVLNLEVG